MLIILFRTLLVLLLIISCNNAQVNTQSLQKSIQASLDSLSKEVGFPGATCSILLPDDEIISFSTGYSDYSKKIKMKPKDKMLLGSTGKTFVAAVLMELIEEGKLKLDDEVSKYLGEKTWYEHLPNHKELTVNMLAHHTGGLPRYVFIQKFGEDLMTEPNRIWKPEELIAYIFDSDPIHPAGEGWFYSDTDYLLLGMIIEEVTNNTFYDEVEKRFLIPHNLENISPAISREMEGVVQGYSGNNPLVNAPSEVMSDGKYFISPQFEWCGGGFYTDTHDLAKWAKLFYGGEILSKKCMKEIQAPVDYETGHRADVGYGIAAMISKTPFGIKVGHTGTMPGYITEIGYYKEKYFVLVLQINEDNFHGNKKNLAEYSIVLAGIVNDYLK